ncbi:unnamed protein product, partial [Durusdinium trenchii]
PNMQLLSLKWKLVAAISRGVLMAKLLYRLSFIDVESTSMVPMPRVQSCPNLVHRCDWPDWQRQIQVRTLCERSEHIGDETQATLKFPQPGASQGSHGHPDLCRRPCILFLHGNCQEGADCGFCHASHHRRVATFNRHQRKVLTSWSHVKLLEAVRPYVQDKVEAINHPGASVLLELIDRELAIRDRDDSASVGGVPREIRHTIAGMSLSGLVGLVCSKSVTSPFSQLLRKAMIDLRQQVAGFEP